MQLQKTLNDLNLLGRSLFAKVSGNTEFVYVIRANEEPGVKLVNAWEERIYDREDGRKEGREEGRKESQKEK